MWMQLSVLSFFMLQLPMMLVEESLGLKGTIWVFFAVYFTIPIFVEPMLATAGI